MVKLYRPLGACHAVKMKIHLHVHSHMLLLLRKYASTYIHSLPSLEPPKSILLLSRENSQKHSPISVFPYGINARDILVTTTCYIISRDEWSKKNRGYEEIKRGKCPEPRRKEKVRREVKMDKCPTVEFGVQDTHLREKKKKIYSISFSSKSFKVQERYVSP